MTSPKDLCDGCARALQHLGFLKREASQDELAIRAWLSSGHRSQDIALTVRRTDKHLSFGYGYELSCRLLVGIMVQQFYRSFKAQSIVFVRSQLAV